MEFVDNLLTISVVLLLACISPGPDFVVVTSHALASRRSGLRVALGVSAAVATWSAVSILGLALILARLAWLYEIVRLLGAGYLIYLGVQLLIAARRSGADAPAAPIAAVDGSLARGFVLGIANPKSAAFFSSLFATLLPASAPVWVYCATVLIAALVSAAWFSALALMFSLGGAQRGYRRARRAIDATMGAVLALIGVRLALSR